MLLVALSPLLAYIALRIKLDSQRSRSSFSQDRRGLAGENFKLVKFRTMTTDAEDRLLEVASLRLHPDSASFKAAQGPTGHEVR